MRLKKAREELGLTQQQLARGIGSSLASIKGYERGMSVPNGRFSTALAKLGVNMDYVLEGSGCPLIPSPESSGWIAGSQSDETKVQLDVQQYFLVPQLSVHVSAGNGYAVDTEDVIGRFAFRRDWLSKKVASADAARVITAKGRSMEPTVRDGDILLVDTTPQERLTDGIYVLDVEGESRCKRLQQLLDGGLRIHSDNASEFPPQDVPPGRVDLVRVVGRVIWVGGER